MLSRLLAHMSAYSIGSFLATLAGLVSFPVFTRLFSVEEYGLMSLISASLLILVGLAKLGVQHSIVRFYAEAVAPNRSASLTSFYSTVFFGLATTGLLASLLWAVASQLIPAERWSDPRVRHLLLLTAGLVFIRTADSALVNILRAQERSFAYNVYVVVKRYALLGTILVTVFYLVPGLDGFYAGTIAVETLAVLALFVFMRRTCQISLSAFSLPKYRAMLAFGIPMIAFEVFGITLASGDRFVIQHLLGEEAVGIYSAAFNLCEYIQLVLLASVGQAIVPMYMRLWEEKGESEVRRFVQDSLYYYIMLGAAVVAGLAAVSVELLIVLASEKYRAGATVMPYVIAGMVVGGASSMIGAGLNIHKQTLIRAALVTLCAVLNIVFNVLLVPRFGIAGSAMASLLSYVLLAVLTLVVSNRSLPITLPWAALAKFPLLALAMYLAIQPLVFPSAVVSLLAKTALGAVLYLVLVVAFDRTARLTAAKVLQRLRRRVSNRIGE